MRSHLFQLHHGEISRLLCAYAEQAEGAAAQCAELKTQLQALQGELEALHKRQQDAPPRNATPRKVCETCLPSE
jgi:hypothetical protein